MFAFSCLKINDTVQFLPNMKFFSALVFLALLAQFTAADYSNYKVLKATIKNAKQYEAVKQLKLSTPECQFWNELRNFGDSLDIMVPPGSLDIVKTQFANNSIVFEEKIGNVQALIDRSYYHQVSRNVEEIMEWTEYHDLPVIERWMESLVAKFPRQVSLFSIGKSYQGRDIKGLRISYKYGNKAVFIESNIHAREWITSATITFFIDQLLHSRRPAVREIAENLDWYIIPVLNVDGFAYTHAHSNVRFLNF